jgi:DNA-binding GntR family transcriptional regulator
MMSDDSLPRINVSKISNAAYDILRGKIISREFSAGQRLDLDAIERQLGISRTPIREALARLEMEGLVEILPRSGTFVTNPDKEDISESFDVRCALEMYALEKAIERMTEEDLAELTAMVRELGELACAEDRDEIYPYYLSLDHQFHHRLVELSGNARLCQAHDRENLHAQMARIRYRRSERELGIAQQEHERIITALETEDVRQAQLEVSAHLQRAKRSLLEDMHNETDN